MAARFDMLVARTTARRLARLIHNRYPSAHAYSKQLVTMLAAGAAHHKCQLPHLHKKGLGDHSSWSTEVNANRLGDDKPVVSPLGTEGWDRK